MVNPGSSSIFANPSQASIPSSNEAKKKKKTTNPINEGLKQMQTRFHKKDEGVISRAPVTSSGPSVSVPGQVAPLQGSQLVSNNVFTGNANKQLEK